MKLSCVKSNKVVWKFIVLFHLTRVTVPKILQIIFQVTNVWEVSRPIFMVILVKLHGSQSTHLSYISTTYYVCIWYKVRIHLFHFYLMIWKHCGQNIVSKSLFIVSNFATKKSRQMGGRHTVNSGTCFKGLVSKHAINPGTSQFPKFSCCQWWWGIWNTSSTTRKRCWWGFSLYIMLFCSWITSGWAKKGLSHCV